MALFGLGNFGEGFIEGLATSANKALQDDIRRINLRAEKVADFQVKRTVEAQEKRKKDLEEIEDALREAEGLFDKDDPRAAAYAASLLEEQGSASALKAFTKQIKDSNQEEVGGKDRAGRNKKPSALVFMQALKFKHITLIYSSHPRKED